MNDEKQRVLCEIIDGIQWIWYLIVTDERTDMDDEKDLGFAGEMGQFL